MINCKASNHLSIKFTIKNLFCLALFNLIPITEQLKFSSVQIPALVQRNTNFWISCQYELNLGDYDDQLYSVKWYKNNEEFYRLLFSTQNTTAESNQSSNVQQQQYFAQAGVNVMMSSSNATHVRLLNASLESEGSYACEISTQNLSTIRYEHEIKVYVLPHSKLNITGLKSRYSVGDKVELICSTDYSRPQPALGWFINGQLIDASLSQWFELDQQSRSKTNEPSLFRLTLSLKFKLSLELLALASSMPNNEWEVGQNDNQRNQSLTLITSITGKRGHQRKNQQQQQEVSRGSSAAAAAATLLEPLNNKQHHQLSPYQLHSDQKNNNFELKLRCKYKLTEVSDVSFNEMVARLASSSSPNTLTDGPSNVDAVPERGDDVDASDKRRKLEQLETEKRWISSRRRSRSWSVGAEEWESDEQIVLGKSLDNRLVQSKCPAPANRAIWQALVKVGCAKTHDSLLAEDPLILKVDNSLANQAQTSANEVSSFTSLKGNEEDEEPRKRRRRLQPRHQSSSNGAPIEPPTMPEPIESSIGDRISINCSTVSAFLFEFHNNNWQPAPFSELEQASSTPPTPAPVSPQPQQQCFSDQNSLARRKLIISGKHQQQTAVASSNEDQAAFYQRQHFQQRTRTTNPRQVAYLSLSDQKWGPIQHQQQQPVAQAADSSDTLSQHQQQQNLLSPPLLEWFINNQEAPKFNAKYSPELPLLMPALDYSKQAGSLKQTSLNDPGPVQSALRSPGGATSPRSNALAEVAVGEVLPSIDYQSYFANFNSRSIHQHLVLNLTLDKKHFMTPDSKLRLRCSSTQAQVLLYDSASVAIIASFDEPHQRGWQQKASSRTYHSKSSTHQGSSAFKSTIQRDQANSRRAIGKVLSVTLPLATSLWVTLNSFKFSYL